jgi:hypothetical protein
MNFVAARRYHASGLYVTAIVQPAAVVSKYYYVSRQSKYFHHQWQSPALKQNHVFVELQLWHESYVILPLLTVTPSLNSNARRVSHKRAQLSFSV